MLDSFVIFEGWFPGQMDGELLDQWLPGGFESSLDSPSQIINKEDDSVNKEVESIDDGVSEPRRRIVRQRIARSMRRSPGVDESMNDGVREPPRNAVTSEERCGEVSVLDERGRCITEAEQTQNKGKRHAARTMLLQRLCLKPTYSLRWQLLLSFGSSTFFCLTIVLVVSIVLSTQAGHLIQERAGLVMRKQVERNLVQSTRFTAETFTEYLLNIEGAAQMVAEFVMDRIAGYPNDGWINDTHVPFLDILSQRNVYPLDNDPLPLDWNITADLTAENAQEMLQEREEYASVFAGLVSTSHASFFLRKGCDPDAEPGDYAFIEDCSPANNDAQQGGVFDSPTTYGLYEKSGDIGVLLRPLFESHPDVLMVGVYFVDSGVGAHIVYPGYIMQNAGKPYSSLGCEWMRDINPNTGKRYGSEDDISRCHPPGTTVEARDYNHNERKWFQQMVKAEGKIVHIGLEAFGKPMTLVSVGKAVYDRITGELIGCVTVDLSVTRLNALLKKVTPSVGEVLAIVDYQTGALVGNSEDSGFLVSDHHRLSDLGIPNDDTVLEILRKSVNETVREGWEPGTNEELALREVFKFDFGMVSVYPLPVPPVEHNSNYIPRYLVIQLASERAISPIEDFEDAIDEEIRNVTYVTIAIGVFGLVVTLAFVWCVARMFTLPLRWIGNMSEQIVNHADKSAQGILVEDFETSRWAPNTEIMDLVTAFQRMIKSFSGKHPPSVAEVDHVEIKNSITWQSDFCQLYEKSLDATKTAKSNTSSTTPQTEEETREEPSSSRGDEEIGENLNRAFVPPDKTGEPRWRGDFSASLGKVSEVRQGRPLSFVAGKKEVLDTTDERKAVSVVPAPPKQNLGQNIPVKTRHDEKLDTVGWLWVTKSRLFRWIILFLVAPLVLATTAICVLVTINIVSTVPGWVDTLADESLEIANTNLAETAVLKSSLIEEMLREPMRDLYIFSRVANWVHSGAIRQANSFTEVDHATEDCKSYDNYKCPLFDAPHRFPCPCEWDDKRNEQTEGEECDEQGQNLPRFLQKRFYACQSKGTNPFTGERPSAFGVVLDNSPSASEWWGNVSELPGASEYDENPTLDSSYRRARISSAFSVVEFPIYNYVTELGRQKHHLGTFTAYEADGMMTGWAGCSYIYPNYANFVSSSENFAFEVRPELCPVGEYGYDPRCRPWYDETWKKYSEKNEWIHLTAPYLFSDGVSIGLTAASPIMDSSSNTLIGQVLLDFLPHGMEEAFDSINRPISFMVATEEDSFGGDTVIGPDRSQGWKSEKITNLLFPYDAESSEARRKFEENFLNPMKTHTEGTGQFSRTGQGGEKEEFTMSFYPVQQRILRPVNSIDIKRGVAVHNPQVYAIAIASFNYNLTAAFRDVKDETNNDLNRLAIIDIVLAVTVTMIFIAFAIRVTIHVTKPMILLLDAVESINSKDDQDGIPPLQGGSREYQQVYQTFSKLNKVVGISNNAFFSGSLDWAYHFIYNALQLFRKIDDQKAIGVACNNLGNTIFAMAVQGQPLWMLNTVDRPNVTVQTALDYYEEAIEICKRDLDGADGSFLKAEYAQHLADRYFNRALYLLFIQHGPDAPKESHSRALDDIARARDLDYDVRDFFLEKKLLFEYSDIHFKRLLRRIFGLSNHCFDEEVKQVWHVRDLIQDADSLLFAAWNEQSAPVFRDVGKVNRLQQLECAALRLELCEGNTTEAARMGMRMLVEDEYVLECAFPIAATAVLESMESNDDMIWSPSTCLSFRNDVRAMTSVCRNAVLDLGKCFIFALELNERWEGGPLLEKVKSHCLRIFDMFCKDEDHVGVAAYTVRGDQTLSLARKTSNADKQRRMLDVATTSTSEMVSPSLPFAMQMIVDSGETLEKDTFVLLLTDGYSWDLNDYRVIKQQIEKMNRERRTTIHLLILGLDIEDEEVVVECRSLSSVSKSSFFVEVTPENVDIVFASLIAAVTPVQITGPCLQGMTMEDF